jgi:hypothetical protein
MANSESARPSDTNRWKSVETSLSTAFRQTPETPQMTEMSLSLMNLVNFMTEKKHRQVS